ncbi:protein of unknown function [Geoalkalibacter ferrihydriticus]|uniref:DUF4124 domain-containing protein n=2 Tax=Geoalkalibacter ferrihydriticus TaxID=392333 RepID=A0A0C2DQH9_9BACT|nr:DUF4124 domain-containing protein [Geoalkalibacter ferrihydriticus]KIH75659.1 hypothetical protein GFER_15105 [Geoalkalibacter ferrihydriticus DSM 17813]SDM71978.1 protein of unknown function [Geoalkalibacter ferrihydriticus]
MLRWALLALAFLFLAPGSAWAADEIYRCRDQSGQLVMTDDPGKFPPDCEPLDEAPESEGTLSVQPTPEPLPGVARSAEEDAHRARAERAERQERIAAWKDEARELVATFQGAETRRNQAYRRWSYSSREVVQEALEQMEAARQGKEELLREIDRVYVPAPDREEIDRILEAIPAEEDAG